MKADAPLPDDVPKKRKAVESALDLHIAMWLASDTLTPSERRRLEAEKARRKALDPTHVVGVMVTDAGATPQQVAALERALATSGATEIVHHGVSPKIHTTCKRAGVPVTVLRDDPREVARRADTVVALPHENTTQPYATPGVWMMVGFARNRSVPVKVFAPSGEQLQHEGVA